MANQPDQKSAAAVAEPRTDDARKPKKQPPYHVILHDDDDHTYEYVILMCMKLFGHSAERGFQMAQKVDKDGRVILLTTTMEHAELKRDQVHAYGPDELLARSKTSMRATIEPAE